MTNAMRNLTAIDVVEGCTPQAIPDSVFASETPLVLKGLVADWPAVKACSHSFANAVKYLSQFWTENPVIAYVGNEGIDGRFFYNEDFSGFNYKSGSAPLSQILQKLAEQLDHDDKPAIYVGSTAVDRWLPGFRADNDIAIPSSDVLASFWLGTRTRISAHFDFPDNIACVVTGRRRFTLFPPEQIKNLYVGPLDRTPSGQAISLVDFSNPDFERFPKFAEALDAAVSRELEAGDAIFIPSMWWHHVESLSEFNMLVNYWWCSTPPEMGSPSAALLHAILSLRELPPRQRDAWLGLFQHYVFSADESVYAHIPEPGRGCLAPLDAAGARKLRAELLNRLNR